MKNNDLQKQLDAERAQMAVNIQAARDLVAGWMGEDGANEEVESHPRSESLKSSIAGLGYASSTPALPTSKALHRLKQVQNRNSPQNSSKIHPVSRFKPNTPSEKLNAGTNEDNDEEDDEEEESRTSIKKRPRHSTTSHKKSRK